MNARTAVTLALVAAVALTGCAARSAGPAATTTSTVTVSPTGSPSSIAPVSEAAIAPSTPPVETAAAACPYIASKAAADAEGDRVGRVTTVSTTPVGCNFYFQYDPGHMILQISVANYPTQVGAYNAMVRLAEASTHPSRGVPNLVPGTDAVLFQTAFYPPDGDTDWACAFAKNAHLVVVRTQQNDVAFNAQNVAGQIVDKF